MRIGGSVILLESENTKTEFYSKSEKLSVKGNSGFLDRRQKEFLKNEALKNDKLGSVYDKDGNKVENNKLSEDELNKMLESQKKADEEAKKAMENAVKDNQIDSTPALPDIEEIREEIRKNLIKMLHAMLGWDEEEIKKSMDDLKESVKKVLNSKSNAGRNSVGNQKERVLNVSYQSKEVYCSSETTKFSAEGIVKTSDGRTISLNMNFHSKKEMVFVSEKSLEIDIEATKIPRPVCDPLVININAPSAGISDITIDFDLDVDGKKDKVSFVNKGSGFLALDKNGDGKINDGNELFGPKSGDGFKDLAKYDSDGNSWIDENDTVFDKLKVWILDENQKPKLLSLKDAGIGAIYLNNVRTDMTLSNSSDEERGYLRKTGVYLKENGIASTIQHIDLIG